MELFIYSKSILGHSETWKFIIPEKFDVATSKKLFPSWHLHKISGFTRVKLLINFKSERYWRVIIWILCVALSLGLIPYSNKYDPPISFNLNQFIIPICPFASNNFYFKLIVHLLVYKPSIIIRFIISNINQFLFNNITLRIVLSYH